MSEVKTKTKKYSLEWYREEAARKSVRPLERDADNTYLKCPECFYVEQCQAFDVLGADDENVFCNNCGNEFELKANVV